MAGRTIPSLETRTSELVRAIRELFQGRSHAVGVVTLTANAASTAVAAANCGEDSCIDLMPLTANAAAALATTYIPAATIVPGGFTITHANNAQVDKSFRWSIRG